MLKVLISGGAGFIGSHLVERFVKTGNTKIIVIDDLSAGNHNVGILKENRVKLIKKDIRFSEFAKELSQDFDIIIHLAAMNRAPRSIKDPVMSNKTNINGTVNILELARKKDCRVIFTSSSSVFGHLTINPRPEETSEFLPSHPYGLGKMTSEHYCRLYRELYDLDTRIIRYFAVYGPRQSPKLTYSAVIPKFISAVINNEPIKIYGGDQTRNFTFVEDTVEATYLVSIAEKVRKRIYQVGGNEEISIKELANVLEKITGKKIVKEFDTYAKGDIFRSVPEMKNLKAEFNFTPKYTFFEGLKCTYNWFLNNQGYFN